MSGLGHKKLQELRGQYLATLERMNQIVDEQNQCLKNEEWQRLLVLSGRKENAFLTLKMIWNQLTDSDISKSIDLGDRIQAKETIQKILAREKQNRELLLKLRAEVKSTLGQLKRYEKNSKSYLMTIPPRREMGLNLVG